MALSEKKILFLCTENAVRSPMAEALYKYFSGPDARVFSAGVDATQIHPFAIAAMMEQDINLMDHESRSYTELNETGFDLIVALSVPAWDLARTLIPGNPDATIEYWDTAAPPPMTDGGNRDQIMQSYRQTRDDIARHIANRFNLPAR